MFEGSLEVKLPTIWTDGKQSRAEAERRERLEERRVERERVRRKKMQMREKVGKSRNTVFFQWFVAPEGRKVGSLKRRVRSQLARWEMKNCTPLWHKAHHGRTTFGSWDVEKVHAVVARSTFPSQNVQNTPGVGPLLEVEMSKKCTPLWREAHFEVKNVQNTPALDHFWKLRCRKSARRCCAKQHFQVKMYKTPHVAPLFEVPMWEKCTAVVARSTCRSEHVQSTTCSWHFWRFRYRFAWQAQGIVHFVKNKQNARVREREGGRERERDG